MKKVKKWLIYILILVAFFITSVIIYGFQNGFNISSQSDDLTTSEKVYYISKDLDYGPDVLDNLGYKYTIYDEAFMKQVGIINVKINEYTISIHRINIDSFYVDIPNESFFIEVEGSDYKRQNPEMKISNEELDNYFNIFQEKVDEVYAEYILLKYDCIYNVDCPQMNMY